MSNKSRYLFLFFFILVSILVFEVLYLGATDEYTPAELLQKKRLQRLVRVSNLDSAIKENRIEIYR